MGRLITTPDTTINNLSALVAQLVEHWTPVMTARVRDAPALDIYETPDGDGLRSVAAAATIRSQWAGRTVSVLVGTLNFRF